MHKRDHREEEEQSLHSALLVLLPAKLDVLSELNIAEE
jgi:hypothetical protein